MSNEITAYKSLEESEAVIKNSENFIGMGLWNIGNELKYIRDNKTYEEKGYFSFEEYAGMELDYSRASAYNYISIAEKYSVQSLGQIGHLGITKLIELGKIGEEERKEFIENNPVNEITTRELQKAIKEKKELEKQVEELKSKPAKVIEKIIEKEVIPKDYDKLRREVLDKQFAIEKLEIEKKSLEQKTELNKKNAERYTELKGQIETLTKQKNDLGRWLNSTTELSGLTVEVKNFFNSKFAPIKYSKAITEASQDETVKRNLKDILNIFQDWINEMNRYVADNEIEIIEAEVME